jgi:hypothetical protein
MQQRGYSVISGSRLNPDQLSVEDTGLFSNVHCSKWCSRKLGAAVSYSWGPMFETRLGGRIHWARFVVFFQATSQKFLLLGLPINCASTTFYILPKSSFIIILEFRSHPTNFVQLRPSCETCSGLAGEKIHWYLWNRKFGLGLVMAHAVTCRPLISEARVRARFSMCGFFWAEWHWDRFFSEFFSFSLSVSFHRDSILSNHLGDEQHWRCSGSTLVIRTLAVVWVQYVDDFFQGLACLVNCGTSG